MIIFSKKQAPGTGHNPHIGIFQPWRTPMKIRITRPVVIAGDGGLRSFPAGLVVDAEGETLTQIMRQQGEEPPEQPKPKPRKAARARS